MTDKWKFGITGTLMMVVSAISIIAITDVDINFRIVIEIGTVLFFTAIFLAGARIAIMALEEWHYE